MASQTTRLVWNKTRQYKLNRFHAVPARFHVRHTPLRLVEMIKFGVTNTSDVSGHTEGMIDSTRQSMASGSAFERLL